MVERFATVAADAPPSTLRLIRTLVANPMETWPRAVYTEKLVRSRIFGRSFVFVMDPELIRVLLVEEADGLVKSAATQRALGPVLGRGLLTADGGHWRWQRRAAAPLFRPDAVAAFAPAMLRAAERARDRLLGQAGRPIDMQREMMRTTFDIIVATMLSGRGGFDVAAVERSMEDNLAAMNWAVLLSILGAPAWTPHPGKRRAARGRFYLSARILELIAERRAAGGRAGDLLTALIDAADADTSQAMSDRDILDNVQTFIAAGHETTALALTWTFYLLASHPEAEARCVAEIAAVSGGGPIAPAQLEKLVFTRQALQEAMRLYPPAPLLSRDVVRTLRLGGHVVEPGTTALVPIYAIHRHRALWTEPERFDPGRFAPAAIDGRHRFAYLPFGAGPRICIGMGFALAEATAVLATILRDVRLTLPAGARPTPRMSITLRPAHGMPMIAERRRPSG